MKTPEEILTGIEIEQATDVNSEQTLFYFDEVVKAMKFYANQKLEKAASKVKWNPLLKQSIRELKDNV